jgi:hypothetical protein
VTGLRDERAVQRNDGGRCGPGLQGGARGLAVAQLPRCRFNVGRGVTRTLGTIELDEEIGIGEGEEAEVIVKPIKLKRPWGEGLKRSAGALADYWTEDDDLILKDIQEDRKRVTDREIPE